MNGLLLDADFDLSFEAGDTTAQNISLLTFCNPGSFKQYPDRCVGAAYYLKSNAPGDLLPAVKKELERDKMRVTSVAMDAAGKMNIDASY